MRPILVAVDDLFFQARIREAAKQVDVEVEAVAPGSLAQSAEGLPPPAIILDLDCRTASAVDLLRSLKSGPWRTVPVVGFVSHVRGDVIAAATGVGCDKVMARSAFTRELPQLLRALQDGELR